MEPMEEDLKREVVMTSVLDEDPPCLVVVWGYTRHHLSDERHGQNLLALKFEMSHQYSVCTKLALQVKQSKEV